MQCRGGRRAHDRNRRSQQHRAGIEAPCHLHDRDSRLGVAGEDGALIGAAPRQRGRSDACTLRQPNRGAARTDSGQDQPISRNDGRIQRQPPQTGLGLPAASMRPASAPECPAPLPVHARETAAADGPSRRVAAAGNRRRPPRDHARPAPPGSAPRNRACPMNARRISLSAHQGQRRFTSPLRPSPSALWTACA